LVAVTPSFCYTEAIQTERGITMSTSRFIAVSGVVILVLLINFLLFGGLIYLFILLIKALRKYLKSGQQRQEISATRKTLGQTIKQYRIQRKMTQEFVAERLNVSRQAVSKWENGTSDPSTSNLIALAKLFEITPEQLLKNIE